MTLLLGLQRRETGKHQVYFSSWPEQVSDMLLGKSIFFAQTNTLQVSATKASGHQGPERSEYRVLRVVGAWVPREAAHGLQTPAYPAGHLLLKSGF